MTTRSEKETLAQNTVGRGVGAAEAACASQSFSYHATVSSLPDADSASTSPSPSTSIAKTERAPSAAFVMTRSVKDWEPSFSYHATVSS